jgi:hypothetical protein
MFRCRNDNPLVVLSAARLPHVVRPRPPRVLSSASCSPCPAHLPPPAGHVVRRLPATHKHCHCLVPASSFSSSPHLLSSNRPLAASVRTLLPPLLPQFFHCQRTKAPILAKKATMFSTAVVHLLVRGTLLESPTSHLTPCCGCTNQVVLERPPTGDELINVDIGLVESPFQHTCL